jgi:hypothetical protein
MAAPLTSIPAYIIGPGSGQPGVYTIPGDPNVGVPAGIEAVFEYNGLLMNIQKNIDRYRITSIDGLYDADIRDTRDVNTNAAGETPYNAFYGGRTLTISGTIDTYSVSKIRAMQFALRKAFADITTEYPLRFRTGNFQYDHFINCKKIGAIAGTETQATGTATRDFQLSLRASNPRFLSFYQNYASFILPTTFTSFNPVEIGTVYNRGSYNAEPSFKIAGPFTGCYFENATTGDSFQIEGQVSWGDYLEFNMGFPPSLSSSLGTNRWNLLMDGSVPLFFTPGLNQILYIGNAPQVEISWRDSWI